MTPEPVSTKSAVDCPESEEGMIEELSKTMPSPFALKVNNNQIV